MSAPHNDQFSGSRKTCFDHAITRRNAMLGIGALGATGVVNTMASEATQPSTSPFDRIRTVSRDDLGWDSNTEKFSLPELPYAYDALKSVIDEETMRLHHRVHHAGYVAGVNKALEKLQLIRWDQGDATLIAHWQRQLSFHMGGHVNHTLYWKGMKPELQGGGGQPEGNLANLIKQSFGSFGKFEKQFKLAANTVEGSGWGWLVYEPHSRRLMVSQMHNQQDSVFASAVPLLGVDVWEHAYYLKYKNKRADYIDAFMRVVSWDEISKRLELARR